MFASEPASPAPSDGPIPSVPGAGVEPGIPLWGEPAELLMAWGEPEIPLWEEPSAPQWDEPAPLWAEPEGAFVSSRHRRSSRCRQAS